MLHLLKTLAQAPFLFHIHHLQCISVGPIQCFMELVQLHIKEKTSLVFHSLSPFLYLPFSLFSLPVNCSRCNHHKFSVHLNHLSTLDHQSRLCHSMSKGCPCYRALFKCKCSSSCRFCNNLMFLLFRCTVNPHNKRVFCIHISSSSNKLSILSCKLCIKKATLHPSSNKILWCRYNISSVPRKLSRLFSFATGIYRGLSPCFYCVVLTITMFFHCSPSWAIGINFVSF